MTPCESADPEPKRLVYLCLQVTREGQASFAHVHEIVNGLRGEGWSVDLFEPSFGPDASPLLRVLAFFGVQCRLITTLLRSDAIYIRSHLGALPTVLMAWLLRKPIVQEINGPFLDYYVAYPGLKRVAWVINSLSRLSLRLSRALVVVTPQLGDWAQRQIGKKPVHVIPNGANVDLFHPNAEARRPVPGRRVVFFGAMAPWHGVGEMLDAARQENWPTGVSLVLVGDGAETENVAGAAEECPHIVYLGRLPYHEVPGVVSGSVAGLVAITDPAGRSATGLSPIKLFETLACGVPAIVTEFPGQADLVREHRCGLVVPAGDARALASAVAELAADPNEQRAMGERGRRAVFEQHSWTRRAQATDKLLRSLIRRR